MKFLTYWLMGLYPDIERGSFCHSMVTLNGERIGIRVLRIPICSFYSFLFLFFCLQGVYKRFEVFAALLETGILIV